MKPRICLLLAFSAFCLFAFGVRAEDKKEETLKGKLMCAKCELKEKIASCRTAIQVKEKGKLVTYYLKDKGNQEEYHEQVCGGGQHDALVKGVVTEKDGKKWVTPTKVEYVKK